MSSQFTFLVYGPADTLLRMATKLFDAVHPKYTYHFQSITDKTLVQVAVFEQFKKQLNATETLTCVFECNKDRNRIEVYKSGGRMGFRGSSVNEEQSIEAEVVSFIHDYAKRMGLTLQEEVADSESSETQGTKSS